jgi:hypothetical protein
MYTLGALSAFCSPGVIYQGQIRCNTDKNRQLFFLCLNSFRFTRKTPSYV